jgi:cobalt/nickel transport system permease protein
MVDALLSPATALVMGTVSVGAIAYSVTKVNKDEFAEKKIPLMGIAGAMVFAGQMINFTIPATGSSGHIGGGMLLAGLLGGYHAFLAIAAVLIIQCLFFADGGLLALGCNIFNLGVIPCLIIYPLLFKPLIKKEITYFRLSLAAIISVVIGLELGAFAVVVQTVVSGVTELPFGLFSGLMLSIHFVIALVEGLVTAAVLCFVYRMRPEIIDNSHISNRAGRTFSMKKIIIIFALLTILVGGVLSIFASSDPDGLEWSLEKVAGTVALEADGTIYKSAAAVQEATAVFPDYDFAGSDEEGSGSSLGTTTSGIVGAAVTFVLAAVTGFVISRVKKTKRRTEAAA